MSTPLLETKLFLPRPRGNLVPRPRLRDRMDLGLRAKLLLVSAPAGFGKTTLLVDWMAAVTATPGSPTVTAWVSLDAGDDDPVTFWTYVVAALRTVAPDVGADAWALLRDVPQPPVDEVLTTLLNDLGAAPTEVVLVLDDYHLIESQEVQAGVAFLLDHLPAQLHLVISSRADPPLPLPRLRARGDLVEVRAADLRFTEAEAAAYLNDAMGLGLAPDLVAALDGRTEGWVAALQLAALSMTGRTDVASFISGFAGDDRYVVDYLVEEVLQRQPADIQAFLLQTSVLERMNGSLCDAVTGQGDGRAVLQTLDRDNLFLVPLDDRRQWYRYHHLFADVLRARLLDEQPGRVDQLHRLASDWFESHGHRPEAVRHAMAARDFSRAADLVELEIPGLRRDRREATMRAWIEALPAPVLDARPVLCHALAGARMSMGTLDGVEQLLDQVDQHLAAAARGDEPGAGVVVANVEEYRRLPADLAVHRSGFALVRGDLDSTTRFARRALELVPDGDDFVLGAASALQGLAAWARGDLAVALSSYLRCLGAFERIGHISDVLGCSITVGDLQVAHGQLRAADATYDRALDLAAGRPGVLRGTVDMHVGRAALLLERDDLAGARRELTLGRSLGEHAGLPQNAYRSRLVQALLCEAEGDLDRAVELLLEADRLYAGDFSPNVRPVAAVLARTWARHGRWPQARAWVDERHLGPDDDLTYLREFEHLTLARVLLAGHVHEPAAGHLAPAIDLLARLARAAEAGHRTGSVIEIRVVQALAHRARGDTASALAALEDALRRAEPEGYVRTFLDEGAPLVTLLGLLSDRRPVAPYARRLVAAASSTHRPAPQTGTSSPLEPLSSRERDVLRLLATDLTGPEIARHLVVSLNTVRTHTKNLYLKLGVNSRRSAVSRARELDLL